MTPGCASPVPGRGGFTLLEILITLALIGLLGGLVAGGAVALIRERPSTGEEVLRAAMMKSRRYAVENMREVRLRYDAREKTFHASTLDGERSFPVEIEGELQIDFLPAKSEGSVLLGGSVAELGGLPHIVFYPDGSCSPFRAQLRTGGAARIVLIDPWTCATMEGAE